MDDLAEDLEGRWSEYATAHARLHFADGRTLEAGPIPGAVSRGLFPDPDGRTIYVITADNPGVDVSSEQNRAAHAALLVRARELGWDFVDAHGGDPAWTHVEACVAVFGAATEEVLTVGREFGQDAVFEWTPQEWVLLSCDGLRADRFAWQAWFVDAAAAGPTGPRALT